MAILPSSKDDVCISCFDNIDAIGPFTGGLLYPHLKDGDNNNLAVNGDIAAVIFSYYPPTDFEYFLTAMSIYMDEGGSFTGNEFASIGGPLTNGIEILLNNNFMINFKANKELESWFTYQNPQIGSVAAPPTRLIGRHDFTKITNGLPIRIDYRGVKAIVRDNLLITGLDIHILLSGFLRRLEFLD